MWILAKINNNCALARDSAGQDVVVFGKGLGYKRPPYELTDLSRVERTFYGVEGAALSALRDIPEDVLLYASDVVDFAKVYLDVDLNPNAAITLADHVNFAIERTRKGLAIETPLAFDVKHFYPKETRVGKRAVTMAKTRLGVELPPAEVTNIALHIIDAEAEQGDMHETKIATEVVKDVVAIIEEGFGRRLDTESFNYTRFCMHLRFLVARLEHPQPEEDAMASMLGVLQGAYTESYACMKKVLGYFADRWSWVCNDNEKLYLLIYIERLRTSTE